MARFLFPDILTATIDSQLLWSVEGFLLKTCIFKGITRMRAVSFGTMGDRQIE